MICPSCHDENISQLDAIKPYDLIDLYRKNFNVDISNFFKNYVINYAHCNQCDLYFFNPLITGDDEFYEKLQVFDWYYQDEKNEYHYAKQYIKNSYAVLEIGSGSGFFSDFINPGSYLGLEFNNAAVEKALEKEINVKIESIESHAENNYEYYDVVCSFQVLEHVSDIYGFVQSALKCLKSGGLLIIAVPNHDSFIRYAYNGILNLPPHHVSHWTLDALVNLQKIHTIDLLDIYQEPLQEIHEPWFFHTMFYKALLDKFNYPLRLVDLSVKAKILSKLASLLSRTIPHPFPKEMLPVDHTVCAVFKKP